MKLYYLGTMGYHIHQMVYHGFEEVRNDYIEMLLHHFVTVFLYAFSYLTNLTKAGSVIMFLHDWADVPTSSVKAFTETTYSKISVFLGISMLVVWFYSRLVVLPPIIYEGGIKAKYYTQHGANFNCHYYLAFFLIILLILHVYWFYVLVIVIKNYATKGKIEDL